MPFTILVPFGVAASCDCCSMLSYGSIAIVRAGDGVGDVASDTLVAGVVLI